MTLRLNPLSDTIGIEAVGLQLTDSPSRADIETLRNAFSQRSVLVIRDQRLEPEAMLDVVKRFGEVFEQHNKRFSLPECPEIHYIWNQERFPNGKRYIPGEGYHTDHSNDAVPPKATVLHAVKLPDFGGDTQFVDMASAYDGLSSDLKARVDGLQAVHVYQSSHSARKLMAVEGANRDVVSDEVVHPLVRTHPENGRRSLYLNPIRIERLVGLDNEVALPLLNDLLEHATQEKYQYRHKWEVGDLVMWDNRCLMHKANGDYDHSQDRYLLRVMLKGEKPS